MSHDSTIPPHDSPISSLYLSDTFYTWHVKTNDLIDKVNPIEVYGITHATLHGIDGITLSDDGYGHHTIGYELPATVPNGHTFSGDIMFGAGVSGNIVNQLNGNTGYVEAVETVSGYAHGGYPSYNVESAIFEINDVTGTTYGFMTLDGSNIPNTIGQITGPAGYIVTSEGNSFGQAAYLFSDGPSAAQTAFRIDPAANRIAINSSVFASDARLYVKGGGSHGIKLGGSHTTANDIWMAATGVIAADNNLHIMCGFDGTNDYKISFSGATSGATYGVADNKDVVTINPSANTDFVGGPLEGAILEVNATGLVGGSESMAIGIRTATGMSSGAHDISMTDRGSIYTENGFSVFAGDNDNHTTSGPQGIFHVIHGATYGGFTSEVFTVNEAGAIGVSGASFGSDNSTLMSSGSGNSARWEQRYVISGSAPPPSGSYSEGMVWYQV